MFKYRLQKYYLFLILTSFYRLIYHILETKCTALAKDGERHPHRPLPPQPQYAGQQPTAPQPPYGAQSDTHWQEQAFSPEDYPAQYPADGEINYNPKDYEEYPDFPQSMLEPKYSPYQTV